MAVCVYPKFFVHIGVLYQYIPIVVVIIETRKWALRRKT